MKILKNCGFDPDVGGGISHVKTLIPLIEEFSELEILTDYHPSFPYETKYSEKTIIKRFPFNPVVKNTYRLSKDKNPFFRLLYEIQDFKSRINYIQKTKFDIFHLHGVRLYTVLSRLNKHIGFNFYQKIVNFDAIKVPKILTLHNFYPNKKNRSMTGIYNHYINQFDRVICVDKKIFDYASNYVSSHSPGKKISYIPNSVDVSIFSFKNIESRGNLKIGFAGRLGETTDVKMLNLLIRNLPEKVNLILAIGGSVKKLVIPNEIMNRVTIYNNLLGKEMADFYHSVDVIFNPVTHSGLTRVTAESMACGRPVIMYTNNLRDKNLFNSNNGFPIDNHIKSLLYNIGLLKNNYNLIQDLGLQANITVQRNLSNEAIKSNIKEIYREMLP